MRWFLSPAPNECRDSLEKLSSPKNQTEVGAERRPMLFHVFFFQVVLGDPGPASGCPLAQTDPGGPLESFWQNLGLLAESP